MGSSLMVSSYENSCEDGFRGEMGDVWSSKRLRLSVSFCFRRSRELMYIRLLGRLMLLLLSIDDLLLASPPLATGFGPASMLMLPKLLDERCEWQEWIEAELSPRRLM
jgi:hypothetical protein